MKALELLPSPLAEKVRACQAALRELRSVVVAFSAGADSTLLLALAARTLGRENVLAAMGVSPSLADRERLTGRELAEWIGVAMVEVETEELADPAYLANPADRCYYCKSDLFRHLKRLAAERSFSAVVSGANADDVGDFRPGLKAGADLGVRNPLLDAGLTKQDVRAVSSAMGLPTWDKPAMACLASRVPYGEPITVEKLSRIERSEYVLKDLGFAQSRVRDHGTVARIEVAPCEIARIAERRQQIVGPLKALGYGYVCVDLQGFRTGSMNEVLPSQGSGPRGQGQP